MQGRRFRGHADVVAPLDLVIFTLRFLARNLGLGEFGLGFINGATAGRGKEAIQFGLGGGDLGLGGGKLFRRRARLYLDQIFLGGGEIRFGHRNFTRVTALLQFDQIGFGRGHINLGAGHGTL